MNEAKKLTSTRRSVTPLRLKVRTGKQDPSSGPANELPRVASRSRSTI